jgi:HD-GYP domain-containing protein (c-di-GMP phosphodiesterase class II)
LPDRILLKPGKLDDDERLIMQSHTIIGAETLEHVARRHGSAVTFLRMAIDIARHHHERYDGAGYPDRLAGENIPLAARIVAIADVYDALRSRRTHRPGLSHSVALQMMSEVSPGQFDPVLLRAFQRSAEHFERIFRELPEGTEF